MFSMAGIEFGNGEAGERGCVSAHLLAEVRVSGAQGEEADGDGDEEEIEHAASLPLRCRAA
jgi:hypothetical protein